MCVCVRACVYCMCAMFCSGVIICYSVFLQA